MENPEFYLKLGFSGFNGIKTWVPEFHVGYVLILVVYSHTAAQHAMDS